MSGEWNTVGENTEVFESAAHHHGAGGGGRSRLLRFQLIKPLLNLVLFHPDEIYLLLKVTQSFLESPVRVASKFRRYFAHSRKECIRLLVEFGKSIDGQLEVIAIWICWHLSG